MSNTFQVTFRKPKKKNSLHDKFYLFVSLVNQKDFSKTRTYKKKQKHSKKKKEQKLKKEVRCFFSLRINKVFRFRSYFCLYSK